jgi:glycosyltransferase involved in cell wall biosynthesis
MRILFVLEHFHPYLGGAEHLFWTLAKALVAKGCKVAVVTTRFKKGLPKTEQIEGITIYRVDCYNRFLFSFFSLPVILRLLPEYDIVHTTSYNAALPAWIAARLSKKPVVITFHEVWGQLWWKLPYASFLERIAFYSWEQLLLKLSFNTFIAVSEFTKKALIEAGVPGHKVIRIYNGMDYTDFEGYTHTPPDRFTLHLFWQAWHVQRPRPLVACRCRAFQKTSGKPLEINHPNLPSKVF